MTYNIMADLNSPPTATSLRSSSHFHGDGQRRILLRYVPHRGILCRHTRAGAAQNSCTARKVVGTQTAEYAGGVALRAGWKSPGHSGHTVQPSSLRREPEILGHFRLDLPPKFAHPANRPSQPGLRGSEFVLLIAEPTDEAA